ncbi:MAG: YccF domain-containing protein [Woeseiaceae bacterium]|nr:YccF domain-containing protein [Woeseiaceae bacterium]
MGVGVPVSLLGNLIFFVFGGFLIFLGYVLGGLLLCITIIGIPFGLMCFRLAGGVIAPFGREVVDTEPPGGAVAIIMNIIWIILPGLELAIMHLILALLFAITIIGLPIAAQHMKLVPLALLPFGHVMRDVDRVNR